MLRTLRKTSKHSVPFGRIVTGVAAVLMSATLIAPAVAQQQAERTTDPRTLRVDRDAPRAALASTTRIVRDRLEREAKTTLAGARTPSPPTQAKVDASAAKTAIAGLTQLHQARRRQAPRRPSTRPRPPPTPSPPPAPRPTARQAAAAAAAAARRSRRRAGQRQHRRRRQGAAAQPRRQPVRLGRRPVPVPRATSGRRSPAGTTRPTTPAAAPPASRRHCPAARWRRSAPTGRPTPPRRSSGASTTSPARYGTPCSAWSPLAVDQLVLIR